MAIISDNNYIRIENTKNNDIVYIVSNKETRAFHKQYDKEFNSFIDKIATYIKSVTQTISNFLKEKGIEELDEKDFKILKPINNEVKLQSALQKDFEYILNCYNQNKTFSKDNLATGNLLYEEGLKDCWFNQNLIEEYVVKDDTILSSNIKAKYEYLKKKFPGCIDC